MFNGVIIEAVDEEAMEIGAVVSGTGTNFLWNCIVPKIKKNIFSVLAAHDKVSNSTFTSTSEV